MKNRTKKVALCLIIVSSMSGCNTVMGTWEGVMLDIQGMQQARTMDKQGGATSQRMRELGWNDDHLLDSPGYGVK